MRFQGILSFTDYVSQAGPALFLPSTEVFSTLHAPQILLRSIALNRNIKTSYVLDSLKYLL